MPQAPKGRASTPKKTSTPKPQAPKEPDFEVSDDMYDDEVYDTFDELPDDGAAQDGDEGANRPEGAEGDSPVLTARELLG